MLGPEDSWAKRSEGIRRVGRGCPRFCFGGWNLRKRERERERAKLEQRATTNKGDGQPKPRFGARHGNGCVIGKNTKLSLLYFPVPSVWLLARWFEAAGHPASLAAS